MRTFPKLVLKRRWLAAVLVGLGCSASAGDFAISGVSTGVLDTIRIDFPSDPASYFTLFRGSKVVSVVEPVRMALGISGADQFYDAAKASGAQAAFYRIRRVPLAQPLDTDGDGIDDV